MLKKLQNTQPGTVYSGTFLVIKVSAWSCIGFFYPEDTGITEDDLSIVTIKKYTAGSDLKQAKPGYRRGIQPGEKQKSAINNWSKTKINEKSFGSVEAEPEDFAYKAVKTDSDTTDSRNWRL